MVSFEVTLDPVSWTEILAGGSYIAFDIVAAKAVEIYFTEDQPSTPPGVSAKGTFVYSHPPSWDYEGMGFEPVEQQIWVRGETAIRGVRA